MEWYKWKFWRIAYSYSEDIHPTSVKDGSGKWKHLFKGIFWLKNKTNKL